MTSSPATEPVVLTEAQLQASVIAAARELGWMVYPTFSSQRSESGFPDLFMVKPPRVILAEIKTETGELRKGKWSSSRKAARWLPGQDDWAEAFAACPGVEYMLVRPSNVQQVYESPAR